MHRKCFFPPNPCYKNSVTRREYPKSFTGEWNSWALFPHLEDLVYLRGKNDKKRDIVFCKPRLSGCYTNILFLIHSSNSSGSWWVITQESLRKCVTTTDHYSRWTTARFGPSKTRKTDMERSTLNKARIDWLTLSTWNVTRHGQSFNLLILHRNFGIFTIESRMKGRGWEFLFLCILCC